MSIWSKNCRVRETQNERIVDTSFLWSKGLPELFQSSLSAHPTYPELCIGVFEYPQGGRLHQTSGQSVSILSHPNRKSVFWYLDDSLCVSVCVCCLLPCHGALKKVCLGLLHSFHSNIFTLLRMFLSLLFRLKVSSLLMFSHRINAPVT